MKLLLSHKQDVTSNDLNNYYGHHGKTFKTKREAVAHGAKLKNDGVRNYITRLINYHNWDVDCIGGAGVVKKEAVPYCIGYLVTVPTCGMV